jgi:hypothetical protein
VVGAAEAAAGTVAPSSCLLPDEQPPRIANMIIQRTPAR